MGAVKNLGSGTKSPEPFDTGLMLMMKYRRPTVSLEDILPDYLPHLSLEVANKRAAKCDLPFPVFKPDGNKSPYYVHLTALAIWLDSLQEDSQKDWHAMNN